MKLNVKMLCQKIIVLDIEPGIRIKDVKQKIYEKEGISVLSQRLIFAGREFENNDLVSECNLADQVTLHCIGPLCGG